MHKSLPKLEKKLKAAWETMQGREFLVNEQKFLEYVAQQWELHRIEKENEKLEWHFKKMQPGNTMQYHSIMASQPGHTLLQSIC